MTYSVKNGTWCKDNNKEYYSATKTGLKAALKAGEISTGTKVVIHEPKYHAGQLIQSLNPDCPEGCFVPHGQTFDTSIYEELAKIFPSGVLPDMRECVMVCAGQNTHIATHEHDVFNAGEFKDDQAQLVEHGHGITDPGHGHGITDPGHGHGVSDPGHGHGVSDPGHGHIVNDPGHTHSNIVPGHAETGSKENKIASGGTTYDETLTWETEQATTNVTVNPTTTGVSVNSNTTGVSVNSNTTGVSVNNHTTGITVNTKGNNNVTRTKQFGVYYYIAF